MLGAAIRAILGTAGRGAGGGGTDYSAAVWLVKLSATLSNGDLTATANNFANYTHTVTSISLTGKTYVELTIDSFDGAASAVGLADFDGSFPNNATKPANAVEVDIATSAVQAVYGIAYDADSGGYEIFKNGVSQVSGTVPNQALDMRFWWQGGRYNTIGIGVLNAGASTFAYTPPAGYEV